MENLAHLARFMAAAFFVPMILKRIFIVVAPRLGLMDELSGSR